MLTFFYFGDIGFDLDLLSIYLSVGAQLMSLQKTRSQAVARIADRTDSRLASIYRLLLNSISVCFRVILL